MVKGKGDPGILNINKLEKTIVKQKGMAHAKKRKIERELNLLSYTRWGKKEKKVYLFVSQMGNCNKE